MIDSAFERLGIGASFTVDTAELERNYLEKSRLFHPDHQDESDGLTVDQALRASAALNEAYAIVADPIQRGEHLLALAGGPDAAADKRMPPEFLEAMLEWREEAEEPSAHEKLSQVLEVEKSRLLERLGEEFVGLNKDASQKSIRIKEVRQTLNQLRSLRGLLRELAESY